MVVGAAARRRGRARPRSAAPTFTFTLTFRPPLPAADRIAPGAPSCNRPAFLTDLVTIR